MGTTLSGKVILVTGAGSGIGRAIAISAVRAGALVAVVGRRLGPLEETCRACNSDGVHAIAVCADIGRIQEAMWAVEDTVAQFGQLDALVNNAGIAKFAPIEDALIADLEAMLDVHVRGPVNLIRAALPSLRSVRGSIVNVSSIGGVVSMPGRSLYGATKAALNHLTRSLAVELAPDVRVNAVLPGPVNTPIYDELGLSVEEGEVLRDQLLRQIPMKRFAEPSEIAQWVCRLLSDESSWVTGSLICIDGGRSC